jgi:hypothetical protein
LDSDELFMGLRFFISSTFTELTLCPTAAWYKARVGWLPLRECLQGCLCRLQQPSGSDICFHESRCPNQFWLTKHLQKKFEHSITIGVRYPRTYLLGLRCFSLLEKM